MDQGADAILQAARETSLDDLSDVDVDPDGSSSLSEIEDKDADQRWRRLRRVKQYFRRGK